MKTQNPFTGRSSGSLANVTASTYLGQNILKSKPLEVRNPQSPKQINVRNILAIAAVLGKSLSANSGIAKRSARTGRNTQKTARTALLSAILAKKTGIAPDLMLSAEGISLQGFAIAQTQGIEARLTPANGSLAIDWPSEVPVGGLATDLATCVIFDIMTGRVQSFSDSQPRSGGGLEVQVTDSVIKSSTRLGVFLMFDSADGLSYDAVSSVLVSVV